ncbi:MAG TPA: hypothetical protein VGB38_08135 [bacterium]
MIRLFPPMFHRINVDAHSATFNEGGGIPTCQMLTLGKMAEKKAIWQDVWKFRKRLIRGVRNRLHLVLHTLRKPFRKQIVTDEADASGEIREGDWVCIRSREEIGETLDGWKFLGGCRFMDEMYAYCGQRHRVFKQVRNILDERTLRMHKSKDLFILDGLYCKGSWPFKECDRCCFFFWKKAWLKKVE